MIHLGNQNFKEIITEIIEGGREQFLHSLHTSKVERYTKNVCPVCGKKATKKGKTWIITDSKRNQLLQDNFDDTDCVFHAILWTRKVYAHYKNYLHSKDGIDFADKNPTNQPYPSDNETSEHFEKRCFENFPILSDKNQPMTLEDTTY
jgi:hypothetical protein